MNGETPVDGRRARGERTRLRVLEAMLHLVEEGELRPTAQQVASRAGVALRTVYHHFEDVEALRRMAHELQMSRHSEILQPFNVSDPIAVRIEILARQLRRLFEAITPIRRATVFDAQNSNEMADGLRRSRAIRRAHVAAAFAPEIAVDNEARTLVDALDQATSWQAWHYVRLNLGRSAQSAEKGLILSLQRLLAPAAEGRAQQAGAAHSGIPHPGAKSRAAKAGAAS